MCSALLSQDTKFYDSLVSEHSEWGFAPGFTPVHLPISGSCRHQTHSSDQCLFRVSSRQWSILTVVSWNRERNVAGREAKERTGRKEDGTSESGKLYWLFAWVLAYSFIQLPNDIHSQLVLWSNLNGVNIYESRGLWFEKLYATNCERYQVWTCAGFLTAPAVTLVSVGVLVLVLPDWTSLMTNHGRKRKIAPA